jgi:ADP-ribosylglycohydrolase
MKTVEDYTKNADIHYTLGCIIYLEILFRLYHNDDLEHALDITNELCNEYLIGTKYEAELQHYNLMLSKQIKEISENELGADMLDSAVWCCLKNNDFKSTILASINLGRSTHIRTVLAGTIGGVLYKESWENNREEWENMLLKVAGIASIVSDKDLLVRFRDHCANML